jgi:hypothetical protein
MKSPQFAAGVIVLCAVLLMSFVTLAEPKRQERVSIAGCPYPGVTANCLMIKAANGPAYNITAIAPRPRASGRVIRVRGTITDKVSACGEGVVLDRIRWTRTRQLCPN